MTERLRRNKEGDSSPMTAATQERLVAALEQRWPSRVWRVVEVCPVAVVKTIDNEEDALRTLLNLEAADVQKR